MSTPNKPRYGFTIIAIGVFFLIATLVLYTCDIIKSSRLFVYDGVSLLLVALGVVYVVLSRRDAQGETAKKPSKKSLKKAPAFRALKLDDTCHLN